MSKFETPEPISVTLELGVGYVRIAASDRTDTVVEVRPSDQADESDVKAAQQVRVDYANGVLQVTGPKVRPFDFSRKTRSVDVSIELPSGSQVSAETQMGDFRCAGRLGECRFKTSAGNVRLERTGPLRLDTSAGHVTVGAVAGNAEISTGPGKVQIGEVTRGSVVLETAMGDLEIGITEGTAAWLQVNTGFGHVHNQLESATRPGESDETVEVRGRTAYGDITIRRS